MEDLSLYQNDAYTKFHKYTIENKEEYFAEYARERLYWDKPFT